MGWLPRRALLAAVLLAGCAATTRFGEFAEFRRYEAAENFVRLPVIFIPGMKGSRLVSLAGGDETELWGTSGNVAFRKGFGALLIDPRQRGGAPGQPEESYPDPGWYERQKIRADFLPHYRLGIAEFGQSVDIYGSLTEFLTSPGEGNYRLDEDLFLFPYDWRLDNRLTAVRLALTLPEYRDRYRRAVAARLCGRPCSPDDPEAVRRWDELRADPRNRGLFTPAGEIKFILLAHSMGGLVARYLVWGMGRAEDVHRLVLMATPNFGSVDALRGLEDGEYPDTVWSRFARLLPLSPYAQTDTKPIIFSFASVFQVLPRHPRSVENIELHALGLDPGYPLANFEQTTPEQYRDLYERLRLLPGLRSMRRYLGEGSVGEIRGLITRHLHANLRASLCFHRAIGLDVVHGTDRAAPVLAECEEERRIAGAERFVKQVDSGLRDRPLPPRGPHAIPATIVFGGTCYPTLYRARLSEGRLKYLEGTPPRWQWGAERGVWVEDARPPEFEYGDGRVPVWSAGWERELGAKLPGYNFFLCEDHVGLVKNPAFRYNLLRELIVVRGLSSLY